MPTPKEEEWLDSYIKRRLAELERENQKLHDALQALQLRQKQEQGRE